MSASGLASVAALIHACIASVPRAVGAAKERGLRKGVRRVKYVRMVVKVVVVVVGVGYFILNGWDEMRWGMAVVVGFRWV